MKLTWSLYMCAIMYMCVMIYLCAQACVQVGRDIWIYMHVWLSMPHVCSLNSQEPGHVYPCSCARVHMPVYAQVSACRALGEAGGVGRLQALGENLTDKTCHSPRPWELVFQLAEAVSP